MKKIKFKFNFFIDIQKQLKKSLKNFKIFKNYFKFQVQATTSQVCRPSLRK
jgi:hypothetical protein